MNFFSHAVVASWRRPEDPFILGAMLPDLAAMISARTPTPESPAVSDGVAFHHLTDRVFHDAPTFVDLERAARSELAELGLKRGTQLAIAHVGIELILDSVLVRDASAVSCFQRALQSPTPELRWHDTSAATRFETLVDAIRDRVRGGHDGSPAAVTWRLERTLARRPRLAMRPGDAAPVEAWIRTLVPRVEARAPALIDEILGDLGLHATRPPTWG